MSEPEQDNRLFVQDIDYENFFSLMCRATLVGGITEYQLPDRATKYKDDIGALLEKLIEFKTSEEDAWRVQTTNLVKHAVNEESKSISMDKLSITKTPARIVAVSRLNTFFVIPAADETGVSKSSVLQVSNLITNKPLLMKLETIVKEDGQHDLIVNFKPIETPNASQTA